MAIGDDAAAAGMDLVSSTGRVKDGWTEHNKTRDYVAQRTSAITPVSKGGTGSNSAAGARSNLGAAAASHTHPWDQVTGKPSSYPPSSHTHSFSSITGKPSSYPPSSHSHDIIRTSGGSLSVTDNGTLSHYVGTNRVFGVATNGDVTCEDVVAGGHGQFAAAWGNNITSDRRAVWMSSNGRLGHTASSERYKKNIKPWDGLTDEQFEALTVVTYLWRADYGPADVVEVGVIAERLVELGMEWAVFYEDGQPEGVHYERIVLAVIPYVQRLAQRVARLEENAS